MKVPLFSKNENYINIIIALFSITVLCATILRVPVDRSNLSVTVFFDNDPRILFYTGKEEIKPDTQLIIPLEKVELSEEDFLKKIKGKYVGNLEFYGDTIFVKSFYQKTRYDKIVKVHYVKPKELQRYDSFSLFKRLWRAVVERSVEVIILPNSDVSLQAFEKFSNFFQIYNQIPKPDNSNWNTKIFSVLLGLYVSLQIPIATFCFLLFRVDWLFVSVVSILGTVACYFSSKNNFTKIANFFILGTLTNFSLYSFQYLNDLDTYRGVKASLAILPAIVGLKILLSLRQNDKPKKTKLDKKQLMLFVLLFILLIATTIAYVILRSGNYGYVTESEEKIRFVLENVFIIRPRIKELLFIPILLLSTDFRTKYIRTLFDFLGTFALVSIFNSFCHIKAPIFITFYREVITIIVGAVVYAVVVIFKNLFKLWTGKA